jgi:hypothetical protein
MASLDDALLPVFAHQHWLVSDSDVAAAGGTRRQARYRLSTGTWEAVDAGVYRLAGAPRSWHAKVLAPILSAGNGAVASHTCAAALHGIDGFGRGAAEISTPRGTGFRRSKVIVHTSTDLDRCRRIVVDGVPVTDINRTILDLCRHHSDERVLRSIEWARRQGSSGWSSMVATLAHHARCGRPGIVRLRTVLTANMDRDEVTDSDFELLAFSLLVERGLPTPVLHHRVYDGERFVAEVDLAYPQRKVAIELDGRIHLEADVRERDLARQTTWCCAAGRSCASRGADWSSAPIRSSPRSRPPSAPLPDIDHSRAPHPTPRGLSPRTTTGVI